MTEEFVFRPILDYTGFEQGLPEPLPPDQEVVLSSYGIPSGEAFGSPSIQLLINLTGIPSSEAFGMLSFNAQRTLSLTGIPSGEAFGNLQMEFAFGESVEEGQYTWYETDGIFRFNPVLLQIRPPSFSPPSIVRITPHISPLGISSGEAFGFDTVTAANVDLGGFGIPSSEAFGTIVITPHWMYLNGIASGEAFGLSNTHGAPITFLLTGIPSSEAFGFTAVGFPILPPGIPSSEAFGFPNISNTQTINTAGKGIPSGEAFGFLAVGVPITLTGIASGEAFGNLQISLVPHGTGNQTIQLSTGYGIPSGEAFGAFKINQQIHPFGWWDNGAIGSPNDPLTQYDAFGFPTLENEFEQIGLGGIPSGEKFGNFGIINMGLITNPPIGSNSFSPVVLDDTPETYTDVLDGRPDGLVNAYDCIWTRTAAGAEDYIEFKLPATDMHVTDYATGTVVNVPYIASIGGQDGNFAVLTHTLERDSKGILTLSVLAQANHYALAKIAAVPFKSEYGTTPLSVLQCILSGTGWSIGAIDPLVTWQDLGPTDPGGSYYFTETVPGAVNAVTGSDVFSSNDLNQLCSPQVGPNFSATRYSVLTGIMQVAQTWGGFVVFDEVAHTVSITTQLGNGHTGITADYRVNLQAVKREVTSKPNQQILVVENQNGTYSGLSAAMVLAELEAADACDKQIQEYNKSLQPDPCTYAGAGQSWYVTSNQMEMFREQIYESFLLSQGDQINYGATYVNLLTLPGYEDYVLHMGEWLTVVDDELGIDDTVMTVGEKFNLLEPWLSTYTFSNEIPLHTNTIGLLPAPPPPTLSNSSKEKCPDMNGCPLLASGAAGDAINKARSDVLSLLGTSGGSIEMRVPASGLLGKANNLNSQLSNMTANYQQMLSTAQSLLSAIQNSDNGAMATPPDGDNSGSPGSSQQYPQTTADLQSLIQTLPLYMSAADAAQTANSGTISAANTITDQAPIVQAGVQSCDDGAQEAAATTFPMLQDNVNTVTYSTRFVKDVLRAIDPNNSPPGAGEFTYTPPSDARFLDYVIEPRASGASNCPAGLVDGLKSTTNHACQETTLQTKQTIYCGAIEIDQDIKTAIGAGIETLNCLLATAMAIYPPAVTQGDDMADDAGGLQDGLDNIAQALPTTMANCAAAAAQQTTPITAAGTAGSTNGGNSCWDNGENTINVLKAIAAPWQSSNLNIGAQIGNLKTAQQAAATALGSGMETGFEPVVPPLSVDLDTQADNVPWTNGMIGLVVNDLNALLNDLTSIQPQVNGSAKLTGIEILSYVNQINFDFGQAQTDWTNAKTAMARLSIAAAASASSVLEWGRAVSSFATDSASQMGGLAAWLPVTGPFQQINSALAFGQSAEQNFDKQMDQLNQAISCIVANLQNGLLSRTTWNAFTPNTSNDPYAGTPYSVFFQGSPDQQRFNVGPNDPSGDYEPNMYDVWAQSS